MSKRVARLVALGLVGSQALGLLPPPSAEAQQIAQAGPSQADIAQGALRSSDVDRVQAEADGEGRHVLRAAAAAYSSDTRGHASRLKQTWVAEERGDGAPETIRTSDLCLRRATLYPAELRARVNPQ